MKKYQNIILILFYFSLFIYVALRAYYLSFTFDEGLSFKIIEGDQIFVRTANNHWLNTVLMQLCSNCFGNSEFSLRLPNLLSFIVYLFFVHKLFEFLRFPLNFFIVLPLLLLNPFILDFFSLARGYGLSMAFMAGSLYYFFRFTNRTKTKPTLKQFICTMLFAALGLAANLSLINFYISILALSILHYLFNKDFQTIKLWRFGITVLLAALPLYFGLERLFFLKEGKELYFGTGEFDHTLRSLIERSFYFSTYPAWFASTIKQFAICFFFVAILFLVFRENRSGAYFWMLSLLILIILGLFIEHYFFEALYPIGRTGIYLIPLFAIVLCLFLNNLLSFLQGTSQKISSAILCLMIGLPLAIHFLDRINLHYCYEWRHDSSTKHVADLLRIKKFRNNSQPVIAVTWIFEPAMNYYNISWKLNFKLLTWGNNEKNDAIYTIESLAPPAQEWTEVEHFTETTSGLFYKRVEE